MDAKNHPRYKGLICIDCGEEKLRVEFYKIGIKENGKYRQVIGDRCKCCVDTERELHIELQIKHCNICDILKSYSEFNIKKQVKSGLDGVCKICKNKKYLEDVEYNKERQREYREKNQELIREKDRKRGGSEKRKKAQRDTHYKNQKDPIYVLKKSVQGRIWEVLQKHNWGNKNKTTEEILGITLEDFLKHIESLFTEGMNWENRSEWHIDHIVPISYAQTKEEVYLLNHYRNLRPLWAIDNISRQNNIDSHLDEYSIGVIESYKNTIKNLVY